MSADATGPQTLALPPDETRDSAGRSVRTRATGAQREERLDELERLDLGGASYSEIVAYGRKKWGLSRSQVERLLKAVRERYAKEGESDRRRLRARRIRRLERLSFKAQTAGKWAAAIGAERTAARIEGAEFIPDLDAGNDDAEAPELVFDLVGAKDAPAEGGDGA